MQDCFQGCEAESFHYWGQKGEGTMEIKASEDCLRDGLALVISHLQGRLGSNDHRQERGVPHSIKSGLLNQLSLPGIAYRQEEGNLRLSSHPESLSAPHSSQNPSWGA